MSVNLPVCHFRTYCQFYNTLLLNITPFLYASTFFGNKIWKEEENFNYGTFRKCWSVRNSMTIKLMRFGQAWSTLASHLDRFWARMIELVLSKVSDSKRCLVLFRALGSRFKSKNINNSIVCPHKHLLCIQIPFQPRRNIFNLWVFTGPTKPM